MFVRPYYMRPARDADFMVVLDATGAIVAQGTAELAEAVVAGRFGTIEMQGTFGESDDG